MQNGIWEKKAWHFIKSAHLIFRKTEDLNEMSMWATISRHQIDRLSDLIIINVIIGR